MSNATYVRAMGWGVGTVLDGSAVDDPSVGIERPKQRIITAIGQTIVVVRDRLLLPSNEYGEWGSERFGTFDARPWTKADLCDSCSHCMSTFLSARPFPENLQWPFIVCSTCGNKRCPKANSHHNKCTGSNEPGQPGSSYPAIIEGND